VVRAVRGRARRLDALTREALDNLLILKGEAVAKKVSLPTRLLACSPWSLPAGLAT
jgi:hypothetical protein